jgi:DNA replication protein DnaC
MQVAPGDSAEIPAAASRMSLPRRPPTVLEVRHATARHRAASGRDRHARRAPVRAAIPPPSSRVPRTSKLDPWQRRIAELLDRFPDITAQRVFETLRDEGCDGGYTAVKRRVRLMRPPPKPAPSLPTPVFGPGEMAESDWSPYTVQFTTGKTVIVQALSYVLVSSRRKFFGLYESNDLHALMDGHVQAFARFDGCAQQCKYDSQKPVVLRWECNQPIYNPQFLAFSSYYEFRPVAVRRVHPNDKPRTERSFWEVERSFLNGRVEVAHKLEQRIARRITTSGLTERKSLEGFQWDFQPTLDKALVLELARLDFVRRHDDLVITGDNGTGKSHILKAFVMRACEQGLRVLYARCVDLIDDLHAGLADGTYSRRLKRWARPDLLVIDDVGLGQVKRRGDEPTAAHTLYNLIDRRHGQVSTAVTSNIALGEWGRYHGDATLTAAILDRLAMHAIRIDIPGPSWRQHIAKMREAERAPST